MPVASGESESFEIKWRNFHPERIAVNISIIQNLRGVEAVK